MTKLDDLHSNEILEIRNKKAPKEKKSDLKDRNKHAFLNSICA